MLTKKTEADYHALAASRGIYWIGNTIPKRTMMKTKWQCSLCHVWDAPYNTIRQGHGCPCCSPQAKKDNEDYHALAFSRGFEWIADQVPKNTRQKTKWRCSRGHVWETRYSTIQCGYGCPQCVNAINGRTASKPQIEIAQRLGGVVNFKDCGTRIDVALRVQGVNVAIEYDGYYWHKGKQERDAMVTQRLINGGWRVLRIKGNNRDDLPTNGQIFDCIHDLINGWTYAEIDMNK